jgi:hypothetical protein
LQNPKKAITFRLNSDSDEKMREIAQNERRTISSLLDLAVREFLERRLSESPRASTVSSTKQQGIDIRLDDLLIQINITRQ